MLIDDNSNVKIMLSLCEDSYFFISLNTPVASAVPVKITPVPTTIIRVICSPIKSAPQIDPNSGTKKVTVMALVLPISANKRKKIK